MSEPSNSSPVIEIDHLTKYYGTREIVSDLSLTVPRGTIYGFLGRNGMGKTTTIRTFLGFEDPTRGATRVLEWIRGICRRKPGRGSAIYRKVITFTAG